MCYITNEIKKTPTKKGSQFRAILFEILRGAEWKKQYVWGPRKN